MYITLSIIFYNYKASEIIYFSVLDCQLWNALWNIFKYYHKNYHY